MTPNEKVLQDALRKISLSHNDTTSSVGEKFYASVKIARAALVDTAESEMCPKCDGFGHDFMPDLEGVCEVCNGTGNAVAPPVPADDAAWLAAADKARAEGFVVVPGGPYTNVDDLMAALHAIPAEERGPECILEMDRAPVPTSEPVATRPFVSRCIREICDEDETHHPDCAQWEKVATPQPAAQPSDAQIKHILRDHGIIDFHDNDLDSCWTPDAASVSEILKAIRAVLVATKEKS